MPPSERSGISRDRVTAHPAGGGSVENFADAERICVAASSSDATASRAQGIEENQDILKPHRRVGGGKKRVYRTHF